MRSPPRPGGRIEGSQQNQHSACLSGQSEGRKRQVGSAGVGLPGLAAFETHRLFRSGMMGRVFGKSTTGLLSFLFAIGDSGLRCRGIVAVAVRWGPGIGSRRLRDVASPERVRLEAVCSENQPRQTAAFATAWQGPVKVWCVQIGRL